MGLPPALPQQSKGRRRFALAERILLWGILVVVMPFFGAGSLRIPGPPFHEWSAKQLFFLLAPKSPAIAAAYFASSRLHRKFPSTRDEATRLVWKAGFTILLPGTALGELTFAFLFAGALSLASSGGTDWGFVTGMTLIAFFWSLGTLILPVCIWSALSSYRFPLQSDGKPAISIAR